MSVYNLPLSSQKFYRQTEALYEEGPPFLPFNHILPETRSISSSTWYSKLIYSRTFPWFLLTLIVSFNVFFSLPLLHSPQIPWTPTDFSQCFISTIPEQDID